MTDAVTDNTNGAQMYPLVVLGEMVIMPNMTISPRTTRWSYWA